MLEYTEIDSPIHKLTGATKLICLLLWSLISMLTYNTYVLVFMVLFSFVIFKMSKIKFRQISFVFYFVYGICLLRIISLW